LNEIPKSNPTAPSILDSIYSPRIQILDYELRLANMRHIERVITARKAERLDSAAKLLAAARAQYDSFNKSYDGQWGNYTHMTDEKVDLQQTVERCDAWGQQLPGVRAAAKAALAVGPELQDEFDTLDQSIAGLQIKMKNLSAAARKRQGR
jgi:hypothetical protein